jgi:hypothetical protein
MKGANMPAKKDNMANPEDRAKQQQNQLLRMSPRLKLFRRNPPRLKKRPSHPKSVVADLRKKQNRKKLRQVMNPLRPSLNLPLPKLNRKMSLQQRIKIRPHQTDSKRNLRISRLKSAFIRKNETDGMSSVTKPRPAWILPNCKNVQWSIWPRWGRNSKLKA